MTGKSLHFFRGQFENLFLKMNKLGYAGFRHIEKTQKILSGKDAPLGGSLNLYILSPLVEHHVTVHLGAAVLLVIEIQKKLPLHTPHAYRRQKAGKGDGGKRSFTPQPPKGIGKRHEGSRNSGGSGASIRLEHITVQPYGTLSQEREIHCGSKRTADEALNLLGSPF
jgi:hypothetical protein